MFINPKFKRFTLVANYVNMLQKLQAAEVLEFLSCRIKQCLTIYLVYCKLDAKLEKIIWNEIVKTGGQHIDLLYFSNPEETMSYLEQLISIYDNYSAGYINAVKPTEQYEDLNVKVLDLIKSFNRAMLKSVSLQQLTCDVLGSHSKLGVLHPWNKWNNRETVNEKLNKVLHKSSSAEASKQQQVNCASPNDDGVCSHAPSTRLRHWVSTLA